MSFDNSGKEDVVEFDYIEDVVPNYEPAADSFSDDETQEVEKNYM